MQWFSAFSDSWIDGTAAKFPGPGAHLVHIVKYK
jgi:hypothetical protein